MTRTQYYEDMKALARETRAGFGLTSCCVRRSDMRRIYSALGIRIDKREYKFRKLRGAYFNDDLGPTVMIAAGLPVDPTVFTLAHELKHHLRDRTQPGPLLCEMDPLQEQIEIGAEVFAAELLFSEADFVRLVQAKGGACTPRTLAEIKHETKTTLSYAGLAKRAVFLRLATPASLEGVRWKQLEESIYGVPVYKRLRKATTTASNRKPATPASKPATFAPGAA